MPTSSKIALRKVSLASPPSGSPVPHTVLHEVTQPSLGQEFECALGLLLFDPFSDVRVDKFSAERTCNRMQSVVEDVPIHAAGIFCEVDPKRRDQVALKCAARPG